MWVDVDITGGAKWRERVRRGIEACKALIFVISPASVASRACLDELEDALALHKLVVPVIYRDIPTDGMPSALADLEWVFLRDGDDQTVGIDRLVEALESDLEWRDQHTRLAGRAREWLDADRDGSYVLRGSDLREAEAWLARQGGHRQAPTPEQGEYIARSRRAATRRLYALIGGLTIALVIAAALTVVALIQRANAIRETHTAQAQNLAADANATAGARPDIAVQLALAALAPYQASLGAPTAARDAMFTTLWAAAEEGLRAIIENASGQFGAIALSPDARTLAVATVGGDALKVWDFATHRWIGSFPPSAEGDSVESLAFSPDGRTLAATSLITLSNSNPLFVLRIWSLAQRQRLGSVPGVWDFAFGPGGRTLTTLRPNGTVQVWTVAPFRRKGSALKVGAFTEAALSADGQTLAVESGNGTIRIWSVARRRQLATWRNNRGNGSANGPSLVLSGNGQRLATINGDQTVTLWDTRSGTSLGKPLDSHLAILAVHLSPDGRTLVSVSADDSVRLWDVASGQQLGSPLTDHTDGLQSAVFSPEGHTLAFVSLDGHKIWLVDAGAVEHGPQGTIDLPSYSGQAVSTGGRMFAVGDRRTVVLRDPTSGDQLSQPLLGVPGTVDDLAFSPNRQLLAVASSYPRGDKSTLQFWNLKARKPIGSALSVPSQPYLSFDSMAFSADGRMLAYSASTNQVWLLNVAKEARVGPPLTGSISDHYSVVVGPTGRLMAIDIGPNRLTLWDLASHTQLGPPIILPNVKIVYQVALSPDGHTLALATDDGLTLYDLATRQSVDLLSPDVYNGASVRHQVYSVAFSPDGRTLAAGDATQVQLLDVATHKSLGSPLAGLQETTPLQPHTPTRIIQSLAFTPDGRTLIAAIPSGARLGGFIIRLLPLWRNFADLRDQVCALAGPGPSRAQWNQYAPGLAYDPPCSPTINSGAAP